MFVDATNAAQHVVYVSRERVALFVEVLQLDEALLIGLFARLGGFLLVAQARRPE